MRPLPVVLLVVACGAALVAGLLFVSREGALPSEPTGESAAVLPESSSDAPADPRLDEAGDVDEEGRASSVNPNALTGGPPVGAAGARPRGGTTGDPVLVTGRVLGDLGRPVEGATVFVAEASGFSDLPLDEIDPAMGWSRRAEATTDREGRFRIQPIARSKISVAVRAPGFAPLDREFALAGAEKDLGDLGLDASVLLAGTVVDANGRGVAGAQIARLSASPLPVFFGGPRGAKVAETDARGNFRIDQLAAGPWRLLVSHEDHPDLFPTGETEHAGSVQSGLVFTFEESATIQGRVVGAPAALVPTLSVRAVPLPAAEGEALPTGVRAAPRASLRQARCAGDGTFTLKGLQKGAAYRLTARDEGKSFLSRARSAPTTVRAGDRGVEIPYRPETALLFQVVDAATNAPVTDLSVQAGYGFRMPLLDDEGRPVRRFPEGRVRFGNLAARNDPARNDGGGSGGGTADGKAAGLKLRVEAAGYRTFERDDIALLEGQDTDLGVVRLERAPVVTVVVLDAATRVPVADAAVSLSEEKAEPAIHGRRLSITTDSSGDDGEEDLFSTGSSLRARTGADGRASVTSLPGKTARLEVRHRDYALHESGPILLPEAESFEQTILLTPGGTVIVEVVDGKGAPVPGAEVDHKGPENDSGEIVISGTDGQTDLQGRLEFGHLQAGTHLFKLRQAGGGGFVDVGGGRALVRRVSRQGGPEEPGWTSIEVAEAISQTVRLVAPARGSLAGRITEGGKPLADATVRVAPADAEDIRLPFAEGQREARTDGSGEYLVDGVEEGEYRVEIEHSTRAMPHEIAFRVREGANELDLDLPVAVVEGTVTGEDGKPAAGARVRAEIAPAPGENRPRAMSFSVMVMADGGDEPEVNVGSSAGSSPPVFTDEQGRYSLRGVRADVDLLVEAQAKDAQPARSASFRVAADEVKRNVDLKLVRGGVIEVTVQTPSGAAAAGSFLVRASAVEGPREPKIQVVGPGGKARLTGLKPGAWRVDLDRLAGGLGGEEEPEIPEREVEVKAGETAQAIFEVP